MNMETILWAAETVWLCLVVWFGSAVVSVTKCELCRKSDIKSSLDIRNDFRKQRTTVVCILPFNVFSLNLLFCKSANGKYKHKWKVQQILGINVEWKINISINDLHKSGHLPTVLLKYESFYQFGPATDLTYQRRQPIKYNWLQKVSYLCVCVFVFQFNCWKLTTKRKQNVLYLPFTFLLFSLLQREWDGFEKCFIQLAAVETQMKPSNCQISSKEKRKKVTEPASNW